MNRQAHYYAHSDEIEFIIFFAGITIGFFNESYQVNEAEGVVFVEVGLIGEAQLQRDVPVLLSFSDGSAMSKNSPLK